MKHKRVFLLLVLSFLAVDTFNPDDAFACWVCKRSPSGWGFCRGGYLRGHGDCQDVVVDRFNGTTDCRITEWGTCGEGLADGGEDGEVLYPVSASPCFWTDTSVSKLV